MSKEYGIGLGLLRRIGHASRRFGIRGVDRLMNAAYSPYERKEDSVSAVVEYDDDMLININTSSYIEWSIFLYGYYEREIDNVIKRIIHRGDVAIDVGSNIGCHTLVMSKCVGASGKVLAVEPNPPIMRRMHDNLNLNNISNVISLDCGVSDSAGQARLHIAPGDYPNQGMSSIYEGCSELSEGIDIELRTIDEIVRSYGIDRLGFIKIDTEGNECGVMRGAVGVIEAHKPYILFEYDENSWGRAGTAFDDCRAFLTTRGYRLYSVGVYGAPVHLKGEPPRSTNVLAVPPGREP